MSRVERHGRTILAAILATTFLVLLFGTERLLAAKAPKPDLVMPDGRRKLERTIRLREWTPGAVMELPPPKGYLTCTEGLEDRVYRMKLDADGFIEPSRVHDAPALTVEVFGGSTTECLFMSPEDRFTFVAGRVVEERTGQATNALNGGRSGNHSLHALALLLGKGLALRPRYAVLHENINDLNILLYYGTYWNENPTRSFLLERPKLEGPPPAKRAALDLLEAIVPNVYAALAGGAGPAGDEFADVRGQRLAYDRDAMIREYRAAQESFVDLCRSFGVTPVLMTQASRLAPEMQPVVACERKPLFDLGMDYGTFRDLHRAFNEVVRDVGRARGVLVVDLEAQIPQEARVMYDTVHYTAEGSRLAGRLLGEAIAADVTRGAAAP
jgi:hypothetical protein